MPSLTQKKYNYVYITTCICTNLQYVGSHMTNELEDGYIGSGIGFTDVKKELGKENFTRLILEFHPDISTARKREEHYITVYNTLEPNGYNISPDGGLTSTRYKPWTEAKKARVKAKRLKLKNERVYGIDRRSIKELERISQRNELAEIRKKEIAKRTADIAKQKLAKLKKKQNKKLKQQAYRNAKLTAKLDLLDFDF